MANIKKNNLFLYLALACFLGLIAVFIVDGYMGIYDTIYVTAGEVEQVIEYDYWQQGGPVYVPSPVPVEGGKNPYYIYADRGENVSFRYRVDNRLFSTYAADIQVSAWRSQQKLRDLVSQQMTATPFGQAEINWSLNTEELKPEGITPEQSYEFSVMILRGGIERRIIVNVGPLITPPLR